MLVVVLENAPPRLRGRLSTLLLEVRAGVYIGKASPRLRQQLQNNLVRHLEAGSAVMAWPDRDNVAGVNFWTMGENRRQALEVDGVRLVNFTPLQGVDSLCTEAPDFSVDFDAAIFANKIKELE